MSMVDSQLQVWLQGLVLVSSDEDLAPHRRIVSQLIASATPRQVVELVAHAHGAGSGTTDAIAQAAAEAALDWTGGAQVDQVLVAAAVAGILETGAHAVATSAALSVSSADFVGATSPVPELPALARVAMERLGDGVRVQTVRSSRLRAAFDSKLGQLPSDDANAVQSTQVRETAQNLRQATRAIADEAEEVLNALVANTNRVSEEIDLLWWTLRPYSPHLGGGWQGSPPQVVNAAGLEIFGRVRADPPPRGIGALIDEVLNRAGVRPDLSLSRVEIVGARPSGLELPTPDLDASLHWATPALSALVGSPEPDNTTATSARWVRQIINESSLMRLVSA